MKINFVVKDLNPSGGLKIIKEYCTYLNEQNHDCSIQYPLGAKNLYKKAFKKHYDYRYAYTYLPHEAFIEDADIVIATAWETAEFVRDLPNRCGTKAYFIQHHETIWGGHQAAETYRYPLKQIVVSKWLQNIMSGIYRQEPLLAENGIYLPTGIYKDHAKKELTVLMPYRQEPTKGTLTGLSALELVYEKHPEVNYALYGWEIDEDELILPFQCYVDLSDDELNDLYYKSDIFLFPSITEGFGLPPLEAMARMCAVVTTNVGAVSDFTHNGYCAYLTYPWQYKEMAKGLNRFIEEPRTRVVCQTRAYGCSRQWDFNEAAERFEGCLISLVPS